MKNLLSISNKEALYLLSSEDLKEIYWLQELLISTIIEKLEKGKIKEEPD
ncbi:MAG: hypothetical protein N4A33_11535 [Bacteriovoracaceae bacterium]|jgi:hypothetical protein|nr:hypothetical protein [Bacteriovoracaceae bacterium]